MTKIYKCIIYYFGLSILFICKGYSGQINFLDASLLSTDGTCITDTINKEQVSSSSAPAPLSINKKGFLNFDEISKWLHNKTHKDTGLIAPADTVASAPFAFADFSWLNGTSRKTSNPAFDSKYFTGDITFDFNYTHSYNDPIPS